ncbi:MAG: glycosylhydrolase-like jelly roll fold domain-containing protein, partial [Limisphaerales bacterium]
PITLQGPWTVKFPSGWGAPDQVQLDKLIAWNRHPDAGVRFFSGTASYHAEFDVPASLLTGRHRLDLDLGAVAVMAGVTLNDRPLGILWKPPFRVDATSVLRAGRNTLEIAVANLWINRMIGDQQLPADSDRARDGHLLRWPQWLLEGKPSPTGRFTFTTWELWHKTDPLVESGLIGPVRLLTAVCKPLVSL